MGTGRGSGLWDDAWDGRVRGRVRGQKRKGIGRLDVRYMSANVTFRERADLDVSVGRTMYSHTSEARGRVAALPKEESCCG